MESSRACGAFPYQIQKAFQIPSRVSRSMPAAMQMALMDTFNRVENKSLLMGNHAVHHNYLFLNICLYVLHERNLRQVIVHAKHPGQRRQQQKPPPEFPE